MKTIIHEIGVLDFNKALHKVNLKEGLNIITGKSSTGKSALIEIFDYCFASSEYNVPKGVITDSAELYYLLLQINNQFFVLGRKNDSNRFFFRAESNRLSEKINHTYFNEKFFLSEKNYKNKLNNIFIDVSDVDESNMSVELKGRKSPTPSIRSFMSLILQHQNLIANKHAIFYRFDELEKRTQAIAHMKNFLGFVDQKFYILSQNKEKLESSIRKINRELLLLSKALINKEKELENKLIYFYAFIGLDENILPIKNILLDPLTGKEKLDRILKEKKINYASDKLINHLDDLLKLRDEKISKTRQLQRKRNIIKNTIETQERTYKNITNFSLPDTISVTKFSCPFCLAENDNLVGKAKLLQDAINSLSIDLKSGRKLTSDLEIELNKTNEEIKFYSDELKNISLRIQDIENKNKALLNTGFYEQVLEKKFEIFSFLDMICSMKNFDLSKKEEYEKELKNVNRELSNYKLNNKIIEANSRINILMKEIGSKFDFEDGYKPINLKFSLENFDLYHEDPNGNKIYLRAMGSGANWLYCHITLFLALHRYFIELTHKGINCSVPSILFLDQPTQVYFPNFKLDNSDHFSKNKIKELEHNPEKFDDDIRSVENLFHQLALYCDELKKEFGFSLQIIVTDHADNLELGDNFYFEEFVNGNRWRTRGLIEPIPKLS